MALLAEAPNEQPSELRLVLDDQDAHAHIVARGDERGMRGCSLASHRRLVHWAHDASDHAQALDAPRPALAALSAARSGTTGSPRSSGSSCSSLPRGRGRDDPLDRLAALGAHLRRDAPARPGRPQAREHRLPVRPLLHAAAPSTSGAGPPAPLMRLLVAPVLVLSTLTLFGTGVALLAVPHRGTVLGLHKASFIVWFGAMSIHVLAYALRALPARALPTSRRAGSRGAGFGSPSAARGRGRRRIAVATYPLAHPWLTTTTGPAGTAAELAIRAGLIRCSAPPRSPRSPAAAPRRRRRPRPRPSARRQPPPRPRTDPAWLALGLPAGPPGPAARLPPDRRPQQQPGADRLARREGRVELRSALRGPDDAFFTPGLALDHHERGVQRHADAGLAAAAGASSGSTATRASPGSSPGYLNTPDDAYRLPNGDTTVADIQQLPDRRALPRAARSCASSAAAARTTRRAASRARTATRRFPTAACS